MSRCRHLGEPAFGVRQRFGVSAQTGAGDQQGPTTVAGPLPLQRVLPRAPSTTTRISEHAQDSAPCCVNLHGVCRRCRRCQHSVSMARPKARNATLGPFWQGASAAVHGPPMHRRPRSRFTADRLHVDQPPLAQPLSASPVRPPLQTPPGGRRQRKGRGRQHVQINADGGVTC